VIVIETRERQGEGSLLSCRTLDGDLPAVGCHNFLYNVQVEPWPTWLGSMYGLEDLPELLGRYTAARILHMKLYLGPSSTGRPW
jgi:hypothetical protein